MNKTEKISEAVEKLFAELEKDNLCGMVMVGDPNTKKDMFSFKAGDGGEVLAMLTSCVKKVAFAHDMSPWQVIDALGYCLGDCPPPENITPALKEFADGSRALYEYENRSH